MNLIVLALVVMVFTEIFYYFKDQLIHNKNKKRK
jgi:hypothetical protein